MKKYNFFTILVILFISFGCVENEISLPSFEPRSLDYEVVFSDDEWNENPFENNDYKVFNNRDEYNNYLTTLFNNPNSISTLINLPINFDTETVILLYDKTTTDVFSSSVFWIEEMIEFSDHIEVSIGHNENPIGFWFMIKPIVVAVISKTQKPISFIDL